MTEAESVRWIDRIAVAAKREAPLWLALALVGIVLGGLLVGYEPVGGDPDRMYRPLKSELARSLAGGRLPFWSERFGLGVPLVAESHVGAFYPPNLVLYRILDVSTAYRLSMWLHYVALVATTYAYARCLKLSSWGSALAGVAFSLCGFQAIHSSHEPFYCVMPFLPLALATAELYMRSGRVAGLALLALCLGVQWTLGHFQIQAWTGGLVILTGLWRWAIDRQPWTRTLGLIAATGWGCFLAAVQLGPSWHFAELVGQTRRAVGERLYYSFPPLHWFELALPRLVRELRLGPEDPYWFGQQTWGYEAALYVGTVPLVFVFLSIFGRPSNRSTWFWKILVPVSFALATMPRWWPEGYLYLLALPGLGYFRVPARYTLITSLGMAVLAGEGFERSISKAGFRLGLASSIVFAACAATAGILWTMRSDVHVRSFALGWPAGVFWAGLSWSIALSAVLAWRARRLGSWVLLLAPAVELGILFYVGTTEWGWAVALPAQSSVLSELSRRCPTGSVGGETENLPVRARLSAAYPYLGFAHPPLNRLLIFLQDQAGQTDERRQVAGLDGPGIKRWLRRCRVSYLAGSNRAILKLGTDLGSWRDAALDRVARRDPGVPPIRNWSIVELAQPFAEARVATGARTIASMGALVERLARSDDQDLAWFLAEDLVSDRPDARSARLISWDGTNAEVEHDGACDLVIARSYDPGWTARIDGGPEQPVIRVDLGAQAIRLTGTGTHRVAFGYRPEGWRYWVTISSLSAGAIFLVLFGSVLARLGSGRLASGASSIKG